MNTTKTLTFKMDSNERNLYMGFDFGSQKTKVTVIDDMLRVLYEDAVSYDMDLPEYRTVGGINTDPVTGKVTVPLEMTLKVLDMILDRMKTAGVDMGKVIGISGNGRGSAVGYWKYGARDILRDLDPEKSLYEELKDSFTIPEPHEWRDSTCSVECRQLEDAVGGPKNLASIVGNVAFEYSPTAHMLNVFKHQREAYNATERISFNSSFIASLFLGDIAPIDYGDGSISALLDIRTKTWCPELLKLFDDELIQTLGEPVPSDQILGNVSSYLVKKHGFSPRCKVIPFTQDTLDSLVGLGVKADDVFITMGTGDGMVKVISKPTPAAGLYSNIMINCLDPNTYAPLIGWKNASPVRQGVMERCAGTWERFTEMFDSTPPGNNGYIGMYFDVVEITPAIQGTYLFDPSNNMVDSLPSEIEVRAVLESQFVCRLLYARRCGVEIGPNTRVIATGGPSINQTILQVMADIFNASVYTIDVKDSAPLGGCYRAKLALEGSRNVEDLMGLTEPVCTATPTPGVHEIYEEMLTRYEILEERIIKHYKEKRMTDQR